MMDVGALAQGTNVPRKTAERDIIRRNGRALIPAIDLGWDMGCGRGQYLQQARKTAR